MSPFKGIVKHTGQKSLSQFINESLDSISIHLSFETLQKSGFNTPREGFSLKLGH